MISNFAIRPATQADSADVADVIKEVYDEYGFSWDPSDYHADLYDLDAHYLGLGHKFWIVHVEGRAVGTVALELFDRLPGAPGEVCEVEGVVRIAAADCALQRLYVRPSARTGGVGGALLDTALEEARSQNREGMEIWSDKRFEAAHRMYQRLGAKIVKDRICDDPEQSPEWGLYLPLS